MTPHDLSAVLETMLAAFVTYQKSFQQLKAAGHDVTIVQGADRPQLVVTFNIHEVEA